MIKAKTKNFKLTDETLADIGYIRLYLLQAQQYPNNYQNVQRALELVEKLIQTLGVNNREERA